MRQVIGENEYNHGFKITERICSREPEIVITDISYAGILLTYITDILITIPISRTVT